MRADDIVATWSLEKRQQVARSLKAGGEDKASLLAAMRAPELSAALRARVRTRRQQQDLALLCANPFDEVVEEDVSAPEFFEGIGLLHPVEEGVWEVNLDMALCLAPSQALEFGFAATLLSRLNVTDLSAVARALEVSPQPNRTDYLLRIADALADAPRLARVVSMLKAEEREVLHQALALDELPDDPEAWTPDLALPSLTLFPAQAGQRGILFRFEQPSLDVEARPLLAFESMAPVRELMERLQPAPEVPTRKQRHGGGGGRPRKEAAAKDMPSPSAQIATAVGRREVRIDAASAFVDLGSEARAQQARDDRELGPSVIDVIDKRIVVLAPDADVDDWVQRFAVRVSEEGSA